jgi:hypothetical protein
MNVSDLLVPTGNCPNGNDLLHEGEAPNHQTKSDNNDQ